MTTRKKHLEDEMNKRKKKISKISPIDGLKLDYLLKARKILENGMDDIIIEGNDPELKTERDKNDIIHERNRYGLGKRIFYPGDTIKSETDKHQVNKIIGEGLSCIVYESEDLSTKKIYVIKILYRTRFFFEMTLLIEN
eukprot:GHVP01068181.1.p2 GENE.GHVP01068181.1~~GHVP01068181.1.p2  ORF type:complete len:139 (+),score=27.41 GHVP01068181.1:789-1205(+)